MTASKRFGATPASGSYSAASASGREALPGATRLKCGHRDPLMRGQVVGKTAPQTASPFSQSTECRRKLTAQLTAHDPLKRSGGRRFLRFPRVRKHSSFALG